MPSFPPQLVVLPMCKESVEQEFRDELNDLLKKWGAEIEAEDHYPGYPECGEDIRMTVEIPSLYDEHGNVVRERCEVDLGSWVQATQTEEERAEELIHNFFHNQFTEE